MLHPREVSPQGHAPDARLASQPTLELALDLPDLRPELIGVGHLVGLVRLGPRQPKLRMKKVVQLDSDLARVILENPAQRRGAER